jgi:hypothetical protein
MFCKPDDSYHGLVYADRFGPEAFIARRPQRLPTDDGSGALADWFSSPSLKYSSARKVALSWSLFRQSPTKPIADHLGLERASRVVSEAFRQATAVWVKQCFPMM